MLKSFFNIIICALLSSSFLFSEDSDSHIRLYITSDVKGETEPCG